METEGARRNSPTGTNHQSFKKSHVEGERVEVADFSSPDTSWPGNTTVEIATFALVGSVCASWP